MKKTDNYQLSQWDMTDRIEMKDFNADNAAVEAALTALKAEDVRLAGELAKKGLSSDVTSLKSTKLQFDTLLDKSFTVSGASSTLSIPGAEMGNCVITAISVSGKNASGIDTIHINSAGYGVRILPGSSSYTMGLLDYKVGYTALGVYFPLRQPDSIVYGIGFSNHLAAYFSNCALSYNSVKNLYVAARSGSELSGSVAVKIYGLR